NFAVSAEESVSLTVSAEPERFFIRGKVTRDSHPIEGRNVQLLLAEPPPQRLLGEATTDGDGIYIIFYDPAGLTPPDNFRLFVSIFDSGLQISSPRFRPSVEENYDFKLGGGQLDQFIVQGHLTRRINDNPATDTAAGGLLVRAFSIVTSPETPLASDVSD